MQDVRQDPDTIRDTVPIRPLRKWASRALVTAALVASAALGVVAARSMRSLATDPAVQERFEAIERMRRGELPVDSLEAGSVQDGVDDDSARAAHATDPGLHPPD